MHHYPHNIGDFDKATRHLTRIERSIYRDLIELYYDTEAQLTLDRTALCRLVLARTNEEVTAVEQTLNEFFNETPTGWYHIRCELELEKYRANASQKALAGKASAAAKALKAQQALNGNPTHVERTNNGTSTNGERLTGNGERENKKTKVKNKNTALIAPDDVFPEIQNRQIVTDWLAIRKAKDAPATHTALDGIAREARKAGMQIEDTIRMCCERNWASFKASWLDGDGKGVEASNDQARETARVMLFGGAQNATV